MKQIKVLNFGPIKSADIRFGDITFLIGPQASGKSVVLQLLKLIVDKKHIRNIFKQYGYLWGADSNKNFELYFGEGMSSLWRSSTKVSLDGKTINLNNFVPKKRENIKDAEEKIFYIPAQRVLSLANGWPRPFPDYDLSVPYILRHFSESLRRLMENEKIIDLSEETVFPLPGLLKESLRQNIDNSIFHNLPIVLDKEGGRKKLMLSSGKSRIPFMAWSAGQKEFMPLLLGFYWLCPPTKVSTRGAFEYVIVEEPEMGLHPKAIISVLLQILDLAHRGYKVLVSTHSPVFMEFVWAFHHLKNAKAGEKDFFNLFDLKQDNNLSKIFSSLIKSKKILSYYFNLQNKTATVKDISTLDAGSDDPAIADWGGLTEFAGRASASVAAIRSNSF